MSALKPVIITGASGLLGRAVFLEFSRSPSVWKVNGLAWSRCTEGLRKVDITCQESVHELFELIKPSFVIHCAAERRPDVVAKNIEAAHKLNVTATEIVCKEAAAVNATVVYISTDYVFDGRNPPYGETSQPNPLNDYGVSKLAGEKAVLVGNRGNIVLRVPILYGHVESLAESAVTTLMTAVQSVEIPCIMSHYERRYPTHCDDIAVVLNRLLQKRLEDPSLTGIFHWSGADCMTKYEMAVEMGRLVGMATDHLTPCSDPPPDGAKRPYDAHLSCDRIEALGIGQRTAFTDGIVDCVKIFV